MAASAFSLTYSTHDLDKPILQALDSTGAATANHTAGYQVTDVDGREWTYVLFDSGGTAGVAGGPAFWAQTTTNQCVTTVNTGVGITGEGFAGVFMSIPTDKYYVWIQTKGKTLARCSTITVGCAVTVLVTEGSFEVATAGTNTIIGHTMEATTANAVSFPYINLIPFSS